MRPIERRRVVGGMLSAILTVGGAVAVLAPSAGTPSAGAAQAAAAPRTLGYVASVSASVRTPIGKRLVITPRASYVVTQFQLAKELKALLAQRRATWRPRLTATVRVRLSTVPTSGKSRTLVVRSRTVTGRRLITSVRRRGNVVNLRLRRIVVGPRETARLKRAVAKVTRLRITTRASFKVRFTTKGHVVTRVGIPWTFSSVFSLKKTRRPGGARLTLLDRRMRRTITDARKLPLACPVRNALVRRLRIAAGAILSGRRSAAGDLLSVWTADPVLMGGGFLSPELQSTLRDALRPILRQVGTGHPQRLARIVHWPALPGCGGSARAAAGYQVFDADDAKTFVVGFFTALPKVGAVLGPLVAILWPSNNPDENINKLIDAKLSEKAYNDAKNALGAVQTETNNGSGLAGEVSKLLAAESVYAKSRDPEDLGSVKTKYDIAVGAFTQFQGAFEPLPGTVNQADRFRLLPLAAQYENLYLAVLRDGVLRGLDWGYSQTWVDDQHKALVREIGSATTYVNKVRDDQIKTDLGCSLSATTCSSDAETMFAKAYPHLRTFQLGVADWQAMWKLFDPMAYPGGDPNFKLTRMIYGERVGNARASFLVPHNVQYPMSFIQAWSKRVKDVTTSINAIKADNAPLVGLITGDRKSTASHDDSQCNAGPCVESHTFSWSLGPGSPHGPIVEAWGNDLSGNPQYINGIRVRFNDDYTQTLGVLGPAVCDPADVHVGCGIHKYQYDDESLATVRLASTWRPYPVIYPNNYYADSLVFGFRFTNSFSPSGQIRNFSQCLSLPTGTWTPGTQVHVGFACASPATLEQTWTYNSSTGQLSSSNGAVDSTYAPGNVGTVCLQARGGGTTAGTAVEVYNCSERPNANYPARYEDPPPTLAQQWTVNSDGTIVNVASKLCLDSNPSMLTLQTCNDSPTQHWTTPWTKRLPGAVREPAKQRCMTATGARSTTVQAVGLQDCVYTRSTDGLDERLSWDQSWYYDTVDDSTTGAPDVTYQAIAVYGGSKCLVNRGLLNPVTAAPCDGSAAQKWFLRDDGVIRSVQEVPTPVCLARGSSPTVPGANMVSASCGADAATLRWTTPTG